MRYRGAVTVSTSWFAYNRYASMET